MRLAFDLAGWSTVFLRMPPKFEIIYHSVMTFSNKNGRQLQVFVVFSENLDIITYVVFYKSKLKYSLIYFHTNVCAVWKL